MPYYRRRRTTRRSYRRKGITKRRNYRLSKKRFYSKPDGGHLEKLTRLHYLSVDGGGVNSQFMANWWATGVPGGGEAYFTGGNANTNTQFSQCAGMYKEFKITGLKIEYKPTFITAGTTDISITGCVSGTNMNNIGGYPIAPSLYSGAQDSKTFDCSRPFKRYYHVGRWAKGQSYQTWRDTQTAIVNNPGGYNTLPNCQTVINTTSIGLAAGAEIAQIYVTYYIKFRIRQRT